MGSNPVSLFLVIVLREIWELTYTCLFTIVNTPFVSGIS